jgi:tetratricopeptide (TPR) repeat protein
MKKLIAVILLLSALPLAAAKIVEDESSDVQVFFNESDVAGTFCHVVGIVDSIGTREMSTDKEKELGMRIQGRTKLLVRLSDPIGLNAGSVLYVINERNLVVSKMAVSSIFKTVSFEMMSVGYGNFRNAKPDFKVVRLSKQEKGQGAAESIAKGNFHRENGDISKAIQEYQNALKADPKNPEAHTALGYVYLDRNMAQFAIKEFSEAYLGIGRVYDREDRFNLLKGCAHSRYIASFNSELPKGSPLRTKYIEEGVRFASEAVSVFPESVEANYMLGVFYYERSGDDMKLDTENEVKSRDCMLRVIKAKPDHVDALVILAKLYKKHRNRTKAELYGAKAVAAAPQDKSVRDLFSSIKAMK